MANRFKEAAASVKKFEAPKVEQPENTTIIVDVKEKQEAPAPMTSSILSNISIDKSETKKGQPYYLSVSNIEKLNVLAQQKKISASKLLDEILTEVFKA